MSRSRETYCREVEASAPDAYARGHGAAVLDIELGRPRYYCQPRGGWAEYFVEELRKRFGIEADCVSCLTTTAETAYQVAYDDVMEAHIERKFGQGSFQRFQDDVTAFRMKLYAKP